mgnify:FL=1
MQTLNLRGKQSKNGKNHSYKGTVGNVADNLLQRDFHANKPFEKLTTDVTEFKIGDEKIYLSPVLDMYNREIVSYSISTSPNLQQIRDMLQHLCESCAECSYRNECFKGKREDRLICVSMDMMQLRKASRTNITSEYGIQLRMNRSIQVEGAFGVLKEDYGFRRFLTRGKNKTETQFMLLAMAFNIQKLHNKRSQGRQNTELFSLKVA